MRPAKPFLFSALGRLLVLWFVLTLPIVAVLVVSTQTRLVFLETLVHWRSKVIPLQYVFIGDSLSAGGRNWGWKLCSNPLAVRCLAESGFTVNQVELEAKEAISLYHPGTIFIMAGVNDIFLGGDSEKALQSYSEMLDLLTQAKVRPIVTLIPYNTRPSTAEAVTAFNRKLEELCHAKGIAVVNLNPVIAPAGVLLPQYTSDGVHFSAAAYAVWQEKLKEVLKTDHP